MILLGALLFVILTFLSATANLQQMRNETKRMNYAIKIEETIEDTTSDPTDVDTVEVDTTSLIDE